MYTYTQNVDMTSEYVDKTVFCKHEERSSFGAVGDICAEGS